MPDLYSMLANAFCPTGPGGGIDPTCSPSKSVEDHHKEAKTQWKDWAKELQPHHLSAIDAYQSGYYQGDGGTSGGVFEKVRKGEKLSVEEGNQMLRLGYALKKAITKKDITVYRGLGYASTEHHKVGDVVEDKAFMSTSLSREHVEEVYANPEIHGTPTVLHLKVPKGTNAAYLDASGSGKSMGEAEVLLGRGTKYKISRIEQIGDRKVIHGEVVPAWEKTTTNMLLNGFCPTGPGGGIDNSCSSKEGGGATSDPIDSSKTRGDLVRTLQADKDGRQATVRRQATQAITEAQTHASRGLPPKEAEQVKKMVSSRIKKMANDITRESETAAKETYEYVKSGASRDEFRTALKADQDIHAKVKAETIAKHSKEIQQEVEGYLKQAGLSPRSAMSGAGGVVIALRKAFTTNKRKPKPKFKRRGRAKHKTKNPLRLDPSRTAGIRRQMILSLRERFARIKLAIADLIEREDAFGLQPKELPSFVENARYSFLSSAAKLKAFRAWLRQLLAQELTGKSQEELWQRFIRSGYEQGAKRSFEDVRSKAIESGFPLDEQKLGRYLGNREEFLRSSFSQPVAREKVELLATRSFDDLEDITTTMSNRISRTLASGMTRGISPREAARELMDEVDISKSRAETIARTEIIRAHAQGQLMALEKLGVKELGVMVEWSTTGDDKVCELCQPLEGVVLRLEEAQDMLPRHPNCRCAWIPANVDEDEEGQTRTKGAIEDALEESEELAGDGWGPGDDIEKDRPKSVFNFSRVWNGFCPTGPGGGIDNSCGKGEVGGGDFSKDNTSVEKFDMKDG